MITPADRLEVIADELLRLAGEMREANQRMRDDTLGEADAESGASGVAGRARREHDSD